MELLEIPHLKFTSIFVVSLSKLIWTLFFVVRYGTKYSQKNHSTDTRTGNVIQPLLKLLSSHYTAFLYILFCRRTIFIITKLFSCGMGQSIFFCPFSPSILNMQVPINMYGIHRDLTPRPIQRLFSQGLHGTHGICSAERFHDGQTGYSARWMNISELDSNVSSWVSWGWFIMQYLQLNKNKTNLSNKTKLYFFFF